ncbi:MAG: type 3 dihydrofolate reductase [Gammaproteobacteria bacterium]|jgi:dihydrofolate reductase
MRITLVVAMARNRVIGRAGGMPWHLPADLAHFKRVTLGHPVIMGRRTHEAIGRALPGRLNIVVTRDPAYTADDCRVAHSLDAALMAAAEWTEVMVIGGGQLYAEALPHADRIILTEIGADIEGDTHFPELDPAQWREVECRERPADGRNAWPLVFRTLERIGKN